MRLEILHHDNHLLAVVKPAGVPVVPDASRDPSLLDVARAWVKAEHGKPGNVYLGVVHRLDRPVSGVCLFARTSKAAERLSAQFREHSVDKLYWGVTDRVPAGDAGRLEQWLRKDRERNVVQAFEREVTGGQRAVTGWRVLARAAAAAGEAPRVLLELLPETGRPHQLRVAAASLGCPLLGDLKYGAAAPLPDRSIGLHAHALTIEHPTLREVLELACMPPDRPWWSF